MAAAPNSMRGEKYLRENPAARAEDLLWAFEKEKIKAVIANIGGNDSERVLPYLKDGGIKSHPKIFIGYSDVMNLHLFCYRAGLSTFYGHNLLTTIAETPVMHPYNQYWFEKCCFTAIPLGRYFPLTPTAFVPFSAGAPSFSALFMIKYNYPSVRTFFTALTEGNHREKGDCLYETL